MNVLSRRSHLLCCFCSIFIGCFIPFVAPSMIHAHLADLPILSRLLVTGIFVATWTAFGFAFIASASEKWDFPSVIISCVCFFLWHFVRQFILDDGKLVSAAVLTGAVVLTVAPIFPMAEHIQSKWSRTLLVFIVLQLLFVGLFTMNRIHISFTFGAVFLLHAYVTVQQFPDHALVTAVIALVLIAGETVFLLMICEQWDDILGIPEFIALTFSAFARLLYHVTWIRASFGMHVGCLIVGIGALCFWCPYEPCVVILVVLASVECSSLMNHAASFAVGGAFFVNGKLYMIGSIGLGLAVTIAPFLLSSLFESTLELTQFLFLAFVVYNYHTCIQCSSSLYDAEVMFNDPIFKRACALVVRRVDHHGWIHLYMFKSASTFPLHLLAYWLVSAFWTFLTTDIVFYLGVQMLMFLVFRAASTAICCCFQQQFPDLYEPFDDEPFDDEPLDHLPLVPEGAR